MLDFHVICKLHAELLKLVVMVLTSPAVEAAEPLMEVLLVLHAGPVLADGEVLVLFSGPLRCRKLHRSTLEPTEDDEQQHLGQEEMEGGGLLLHICPVNEQQGESIFIGNLV